MKKTKIKLSKIFTYLSKRFWGRCILAVGLLISFAAIFYGIPYLIALSFWTFGFKALFIEAFLFFVWLFSNIFDKNADFGGGPP